MIDTLFEMAISCLNKNLMACLNWNEIATLPPCIKARILNFLTLKCEVNDENISFLVDGYTTIIDLSSCDITSDGLKQLAACFRLQELKLGSRRFVRMRDINSGLSTIFTHCHSLTCVNLRGFICVDDDIITLLANNCPNLRVLDISDCNLITDCALHALADHCQSLKCLGIDNTRISDVGAFHIANGKCAETLEEFNAGFTRDVTGISVQVLLEKCPKLSVMSYHFLDENDAVDSLLKERQSSGVLKQISCTFDMTNPPQQYTITSRVE